MTERIEEADNVAADPATVDRRPQAAAKKSGLWMWIVLGALALGILWIGYSSDQKKNANEGVPTVTSGADDFVPGGRRPAPPDMRTTPPGQAGQSAPAGTPAPASDKPAGGTPSTGPAQMTPEEKLAYLRQRAPMLIQGGTLNRAAATAEPTGRDPAPTKDDAFIRDQYGAVVGVKPGAQPGMPGAAGVGAGGAFMGPPPGGETNPNEAFFDRTASRGVKTVKATPPREMQYRVSEGKLISGVLETALNSDLPGRIRAMIDEDVYGEHGRVVLLPKMTRLIGEYNSAVRNGQTRVFVVWRRAIRPDGSAIDLGSYGTDSIGRSGLTGEVDNHFFRRFGTAILLSIIGGAVTDIGQGGNGDTASALYGLEVARAIQQQANTVLQNEMKIPPTIHVDQGTRIKVFVAQDLDFSEVQRVGQDPMAYSPMR